MTMKVNILGISPYNLQLSVAISHFLAFNEISKEGIMRHFFPREHLQPRKHRQLGKYPSDGNILNKNKITSNIHLLLLKTTK